MGSHDVYVGIPRKMARQSMGIPLYLVYSWKVLCALILHFKRAPGPHLAIGTTKPVLGTHYASNPPSYDGTGIPWDMSWEPRGSHGGPGYFLRECPWEFLRHPIKSSVFSVEFRGNDWGYTRHLTRYRGIAWVPVARPMIVPSRGNPWEVSNA